MNNNKGIALVVALVMTLLVMIIGTTAVKMSETGYLTYGSERKYQMAGWAAEYGLNYALNGMKTSSISCGNTVSGTTSSGGSYNIFTLAGGDFCFVRSVGEYPAGGAKVIKCAVIPKKPTTNWGALVVNSGNVDMGGSGSISFCDNSCPNGGPAIVYIGSTTVSGTAAQTKLPSECKSNEKGPVGYPAVTQNTSLPNDLTSTYFESSNWNDLESDFRTKYGVDSSSIVSMPGTCKYSGTNVCDTTSATNIRCGSGGSAVNIDLSTCPKVYIEQANLTVDESLNGKTIYSGAKVTVSGSTTNTNVFSNTLEIDLQGGNISGGTFFSNSASSTSSPPTNKVYVKSNATLGSEANPVLLITKGYTLFDSNGGPDIWGLVYTNSNTIDINGNIVFRGSFIESNTANMTFGGNASIQFDKSVLETLKTNLGSTGTGLKSPTCGSLELSGSVTNSKITVY